MEQYRTCSTCKQSKPFSAFNKDKTRKHGISYRCKPCHKQVNAKYLESYKSLFREAARKYYAKNKDEINAKARAARAANPEISRAYKRQYYALNKTRITNLSNRWRRDHPETSSAAKRRRRARIRQNGYDGHSLTDILETYGTVCYLCNKEIDLTAPRSTREAGWENGLQIDHVIPIRDGGPDTLENVRPTHGICNLKKH